MDNPIVESCHLCNHKVRIQADKAATARCPRCKGPLGDPKIDQACQGCKAVNRVLRSRLAAARCGKCKEALLPSGPLPRDLVLSEAYGLIGQVSADALIGRRVSRPSDLVGAVEWATDLPRAIAELAAAIPLGDDRDRLASLSARAKALPAKLRPVVFDDPALLGEAATFETYQLADAFEAVRHHAQGWEFLKLLRRPDRGEASARQELATAGPAFEKILNRIHKTDWDDMAADRTKRAVVADKLFSELSRVVESWLPRPYKLEAMARSCLARFEDLSGGAEAVESAPEAMREDVTVFLAIAVIAVARAASLHEVGQTPRDVWPAIVTSLRSAALATA